MSKTDRQTGGDAFINSNSPMNDLTFDLYLFATVSGDWGISRRLWLIGSDCGERSIMPEIRNICSYTSVCTCVVAMAVQFSLEKVFLGVSRRWNAAGVRRVMEETRKRIENVRKSGEDTKIRFKVSEDGRGDDGGLTPGTLGRLRMCN